MFERAHKIELKPTNKQKTYFFKACGISRFTWNWAYQNGMILPIQSLFRKRKNSNKRIKIKKNFNSIKRTDFPWTMEVSKYVCQQPFIHLNQAYKRFFKGIASKPKLKKKENARIAFTLVEIK